MTSFQLPMPFIAHEVEDNFIQQRVDDGYINATAMCKSIGKKFNDYSRLSNTQEFLEELSAVTGIHVTELAHTVQGGLNPQLQGTWVHPDVAIHLSQWLSPKFAVMVSRWVRDWLTGNIKVKTELPYHLKRYIANRSDIPYTHFSILNELMFNLIAPLESEGYTLPESLMPDISEGRMFSGWLRKEKGVDPSDFPTYNHTFEDGRVYPARLYPNEYLGDFRRHFYDVWLAERAISYFQKKDIKALPFLPKALGIKVNNNLLIKQNNN